MSLLVALITYNRLDYTKRTLESFLDTVSVPYFLVVADNGSTDGTIEWLQSQHNKGNINHLILNEENLYPGEATNQAWDAGLFYYPEATHLMRLDNDMEFERGWCIRAQAYFDAFPKLWQLGLDWGPPSGRQGVNDKYIKHSDGMKLDSWPGNVGGTNIIKRIVFDSGIRYDSTPWHNDGVPTPQEDCLLSIDIREAGYDFGHATERLCWSFAEFTDYPEYSKQTLEERGYANSTDYEEVIDELNNLITGTDTE